MSVPFWERRRRRWTQEGIRLRPVHVRFGERRPGLWPKRCFGPHPCSLVVLAGPGRVESTQEALESAQPAEQLTESTPQPAQATPQPAPSSEQPAQPAEQPAPSAEKAPAPAPARESPEVGAASRLAWVVSGLLLLAALAFGAQKTS